MANAYPIMLPDGQKDLTRRAALAALSATPLALLLPEVANDAPTVPGADHLPHPVLALPFVRDRDDEDLEDGAARRCFWSVQPSGRYGTDCEIGAQYAALALDYMVEAKLPQLLQWAVFDMMALNRPHCGIEVGFLSAFGRIATQAHAASEGVRP